MEAWEAVLAIVMFGGALWYLYRKFFVTGGCTCGSSGGCPARNMEVLPSVENSVDCTGCKDRSKC